VKSLGQAQAHSSDYAAAARQVNNRLNHISEPNRDAARTAFARYLHENGQAFAGHQLSTEGSLDTSVRAPAVPTTEKIVIPSALTEQGYIQDLAGYQDLLNAAGRQRDSTKTSAEGQYEDMARKMGYGIADKSWDRNNTNADFGGSYRNLLEDWGSRGMLNSTLYNDALSGLYDTFNNRQQDIYNQWQDAGKQADTGYQNAADAFETNKQGALQRAIQRIMADKGVSIGDVPTTGTAGRTITRNIGS